MSGFSFGAGTSTGFPFGAKTTAQATPAQATPGGFSFGQATSNTAPASGSTFSLGGNAAASKQSFSFGASTTTTSANPPNMFSLGGTTAAKTSAPPPAFGSTAFTLGSAKPASSTTSLPSFGAPSFSLSAQKTATTASTSTPRLGSTGFSLPGTKPAATTSATPAFGSTGFALGGAKPASTVAPTLSFGVAAAVATSSNTLGATTTTSSSGFGGFSLNASTAAKSSTSTVTALATTSTTLGATAPSLKQMSYKELEETVDKWLHDLTEQEKSFLNQASQVNMWDKQLIENGENITELNSEVGRVKAEQQRLDRELDFILSQQEELEDLLKPIEEQVKSQQAQQYTQHSDIERERTFRMAENVDSQLKGMMQDLREIIEHINTSNEKPAKTVDDTMSQIAKILNAHMDSLQWVDQNSTQLQRRVDEVNHILESRKRDHERSFHLTY